MNFYSLFYWLTVADGAKSFFDTASNLFTWFSVLTFIAYMFAVGIYASEVSSSGEDTDDAKALVVWRNGFKTAFISFFIMCLISWFAWIFIPSKKDALIIIAGGAVGNFVTRDSSAKHIPHEVMDLLREKIKSEIQETKLDLIPKAVKDTLKDKSKEELIKIIENKEVK